MHNLFQEYSIRGKEGSPFAVAHTGSIVFNLCTDPTQRQLDKNSNLSMSMYMYISIYAALNRLLLWGRSTQLIFCNQAIPWTFTQKGLM